MGDTNNKIGRRERNGVAQQVAVAYKIRDLCAENGVKFRLNTVVSSLNADENMWHHIKELKPYRWKVFQCLPVDGENQGDNQTKREVGAFLITSEQFKAFVKRHIAHGTHPIAEDNTTMQSSYLLLDEKMRFLDCSGGDKKPGRSIVDDDVSIEDAVRAAHFDEKSFVARQGRYQWSKHEIAGRPQPESCTASCKDTEW